LRALRVLKRAAKSAFQFRFRERTHRFTVARLATLIEGAGIAAETGCKVHPHMLCPAAAFVLARRHRGQNQLKGNSGAQGGFDRASHETL
jgi:hypothetical protein